MTSLGLILSWFAGQEGKMMAMAMIMVMMKCIRLMKSPEKARVYTPHWNLTVGIQNPAAKVEVYQELYSWMDSCNT